MLQYGFVVGSLFYDAFSVTRLQSVNDRVTSDWWQIDKNKHALNRIQTHSLSVQVIKASMEPLGPALQNRIL
jgi:hypothetical protein